MEINRNDFTNTEFLIMAGGKGTRIASLTKNIPKPMIPIGGKPLLQHQIECLRAQHIRDITIVVGHCKDAITNYFQDGKGMGVSVRYIEEDEPLGTAGALFYYKNCHKTIVLINGDLLFHVNMARFLKYHDEKSADVTLFTHPNDHPYDSALIETDQQGRITSWLHKEEVRKNRKNRVNAGIHIFAPSFIERFFSQFDRPRKLDLDRDILKQSIQQNKIMAYDSPEYVKDVGTPERYREICDDDQYGIVSARNLSHQQRAIFLDRDGTINVKNGFITKPDQLQLIDHVATAMRRINHSLYLAIVITNQPVIARGDCTIEELQMIHNHLETLLGRQGAYIDDLFYCPHHPHSGFQGERKEYKKVCDCRKPQPGLLFQAADKYNIDLSQSFMIGDRVTDIIAGQQAGCKTIYLSPNSESKTDKNINEVGADKVAGSLIEAVEWILNDHNKNPF